MSEPATTPDWLTRLFPDVRDWRSAGTNRYRGVADPVHGDSFDHVLLVCDPDHIRYTVLRVADFAPERVATDLFEYSFTKLERRLARDLQETTG